jgi:predicted RNase H-like HicB family nuclease
VDIGDTHVTLYYVALVDGHAGAYGVVVPDLPGCSVDEAVANAQEAVSLWADALIDQAGNMPPPRTIEEAVADADIMAAVAQGAVIVLIPIGAGSRARDPDEYFAGPRAAGRDRRSGRRPRAHALGISGLGGARKDRQ